jgi:hypothetical protein
MAWFAPVGCKQLLGRRIGAADAQPVIDLTHGFWRLLLSEHGNPDLQAYANTRAKSGPESEPASEVQGNSSARAVSTRYVDSGGRSEIGGCFGNGSGGAPQLVAGEIHTWRKPCLNR